MKPPPFAYLDPRTVEEAIQALADYGEDGKVLAGGQSLVPLLNMRLAQPDVLIDVNGVVGLSTIDVQTDGGQSTIRLGALTRQRAVAESPDLRALPLLGEAIEWVGHPQIRNRGTIGGSIAHADPAAELPLVFRTLDGIATVRSKRGERTIPAAEFFLAPLVSALEPDELLTAVQLPLPPPRTGQAFLEVARRHGDFALVAAAVSLTLDDDYTCKEVHIGIAGAAPTPIRAAVAEEAMHGQRASLELFREAGRMAATETEPSPDVHADAEYRREVAGTLVTRALTLAFERVPREDA